MGIIISLLINALAIFIAASYIIPGVHVDSFMTAVIVAVVLGVLNAFLKPILVIFTLPITIITLGLFTFVINAILVLLASQFVPGFKVDGFLTALLFSLVVSIISAILGALVK
jgi:putative membrane protein